MAQGMSLATDPGMQKALTAVPSYVIAKDSQTAQMLMNAIREGEPGLQPMHAHGLPIFDHMATFYQEGADFEPANLKEITMYKTV